MKVVLDLDDLLSRGKITPEEFGRLKELSVRSTSALAFNILIGFGVVAVSTAGLALVPSAITAVIIGLGLLVAGLLVLRFGSRQWTVLANICLLVGALMSGSAIVIYADFSLVSILLVTALFAGTAVLAKSTLLAVLTTLTLSLSIGARTGYFHASYFLQIKEPVLTIGLFTLVGIGLYLVSKKLVLDYKRLAVAGSRTSVFLVNFGFWVGSLWGERSPKGEMLLSEDVFVVLWAAALGAAALWAWKRSIRWMLNVIAVFAGIHFYTQWFEHLGASPLTVLLAGILALGFAVVLQVLNRDMKRSQ